MRTILLISPYWKEPHRWMVSAVKLSELWQRLGYRVVVACMGTGDCPPRSKGTVPCSPDIHYKKDFFLRDPWNYGIALGFSGFVRRLVQREKPDIIVVNKVLFWSSFAIFGLRLHGHRVILTTDALVGMTWWPRSILPRIGAAIYAWTLGWLVLLCTSRIVFFHPQPAKLLQFLGIAKKSQVIPTGIDVDRWLVGSLARANQQTSKPVTIAYIGRLESVKGVDDFLAAAVPLARKGTGTFSAENVPVPLHIQVVGWFAPGHALIEQYRDQVTFTGLRDDIPAILAGTDIFVLPSHSEGLSNALMEAMASGCACIASDVGGNRYLLPNGSVGLLFPPGDRAALQAHLRRLIEDPEKRRMLGDAARKRIEEEFSWEKVGTEYRSLFEAPAI